MQTFNMQTFDLPTVFRLTCQFLPLIKYYYLKHRFSQILAVVIIENIFNT